MVRRAHHDRIKAGEISIASAKLNNRELKRLKTQIAALEERKSELMADIGR